LDHTLIGDQDGIYDPSTYNDRLLLGLKGTMSEAELHLLKQRMHRGLEAKAKRGELPLPLPMGYMRTPSGSVIKDPDAQVQATVALVFSTFDRCGSIGAVLRYFVQHDLQLPRRVRNGAAQGELVWGRPSRSTLSDMIHHPMYAGVYAYGRRPVDPRKKVAGKPWSGRTITTPEHWMVCLHDRLPAYISWDDYLRHLQQLRANCPEWRGVPRNGTALLSGLLRCGRCGRRMRTYYSDGGQGGRYLCDYERSHYGGLRCQSVTGGVVDTAVRDLLFQALEPSALEVSLQVADDLEQERQRVHMIWKHRLERARYQAERAFRQYTVVEPEHRLAARALEQQWDEALRAEQEVQTAYAQFLAQHPVALTAQERADIQALAQRLPAVWEAPTTTQADRQGLVRQMVEQVRVTVQGVSERVMIEVDWVGGQHTSVTVIRRVARLEDLSYYSELAQRVQDLVRQTLSPARMAVVLTEEGWRPVSGQGPFTPEMVSRLLRRHPEIRAQHTAPIHPPDIASDEWTVSDLAGALDMPHATVYTWIRKGYLHTRRVDCGRRHMWLIRADRNERVRLRGLRTQGLTRRSPERMVWEEEPEASSENGHAVTPPVRRQRAAIAGSNERQRHVGQADTT
jgi:hypothetical protein